MTNRPFRNAALPGATNEGCPPIRAYRSPASGWLFTSATRVPTVRPWPSSELPTRNGGPTMCASMFSFSAGTPEPGATPASATPIAATMISSNHSWSAVTPIACLARSCASATGGPAVAATSTAARNRPSGSWPVAT